MNGDYLFRFPRHQTAAEGLRREICLLPRLRPLLDLAIPEFNFVGQYAGGLPFVGYRKIRGRALCPALYRALPEERRHRVLEQLGAFFTALHSFSANDAPDCGLPLVDVQADVEADLKRFKASIFPYWIAQPRGRVELLYVRYLTTPTTSATSHLSAPCRYSPERVLYDQRRGEISGIIDFGDLRVGDPDFDLMYPFEDWGEALVQALLAHYSHPSPPRLFDKLRFWYLRNILRDLADALDHNNVVGIREGLAALRQN